MKRTVTDPTVEDRWKNLQSHTSSSDVTFLVGSAKTPIKAHKCILASASEAFHAMLFSGGRGESPQMQPDLIPIQDDRLSPSSFAVFLDFVYVGKAVISIETVFGVMNLAKIYYFPRLVKYCQEFLRELINTTENPIAILKESEIWHTTDISEQALIAISSKPPKATLHPAFNSLTLPQMLKLVQRRELTPEMEEIDLFKQVLQWYRENELAENRIVFEHIQYARISSTDLIAHVGPAAVVPMGIYLHALEFSVARDKEKYSETTPELRKKPPKQNPPKQNLPKQPSPKKYSDIVLEPRKKSQPKQTTTTQGLPKQSPKPTSKPNVAPRQTVAGGKQILNSTPTISPSGGKLCNTKYEICEEIRNGRNFAISAQITALNLRDNKIGDNGAQTLSDVLKTNSTLTTLNLHNNNIGFYGARCLYEVLLTNSSLSTLDLRANSIGDNGAQCLCEALKINNALTALNLRVNKIGDTGAQYICQALQVNSSLTALNLGRNEIGHYGAQYLCEVLKVNSTLTSLDLRGNNIGDYGAQCLREALKVNNTLKNLGLYDDLTLEDLYRHPFEQQKLYLGDKLYPLIARSQPALAGKITGMFLQSGWSIEQLFSLLTDQEKLAEKIQDAVAVLSNPVYLR